MQSPEQRKPGELMFAIFLVVTSLFLLSSAYGISGFEALSAPGAIPMATTAAMVISSAVVLVDTFRKYPNTNGNFFRDVLPLRIVVVAAFLGAFALSLKPIGFLPTSAVFLVLLIKYLSRRTWIFSLIVGLTSLLVIYLIFRIVFTVLMPAGIVPEGEILAWFRNLLAVGQ